MTGQSTPIGRKKHYWAKAAIACALVALPAAALAAPASADALNPGVTQSDNSWHSGQDRDHSQNWNNGGGGGWGNQNQNQNQGWQNPNWPGMDQGQPQQPGPTVNPFAGLFGSS